MDNHLPEQQSLQQFDLAVVVLRARNKSLTELQKLMPELERMLDSLQPGQVMWLYSSE